MSVSIFINLADSGATEALGRALAHSLPRADAASADGGVVVYLQGELGAGKTTCARALLRALGVTGLVRSPTYTLVETYALAALTCIHVDLYRLQSLSEIDELGLRDFGGTGRIVAGGMAGKGGQRIAGRGLDGMPKLRGRGAPGELEGGVGAGRKLAENLGRDTSLSFYVSNLT